MDVFWVSPRSEACAPLACEWAPRKPRYSSHTALEEPRHWLVPDVWVVNVNSHNPQIPLAKRHHSEPFPQMLLGSDHTAVGCSKWGHIPQRLRSTASRKSVRDQLSNPQRWQFWRTTPDLQTDFSCPWKRTSKNYADQQKKLSWMAV